MFCVGRTEPGRRPRIARVSEAKAQLLLAQRHRSIPKQGELRLETPNLHCEAELHALVRDCEHDVDDRAAEAAVGRG